MNSNLTRPQLLNIGCGSHFHPEWVNVDLVAQTPQVIAHDIATGLPFDADDFMAVYHSHVLEHLHPDDGKQLLLECFRVLRPGGVLRICVPDLEQITQLYLGFLNAACLGDAAAQANYEWMKLELLDQLVRDRSGGRMGQYLVDPEIPNLEFVQSRMGAEANIRNSKNVAEPGISKPTNQKLNTGRSTTTQRIRRYLLDFRLRLATKLVTVLLGKKTARAFAEGLFRSRGEVHRWMYDRYSLSKLCQECGFESVRVCTAFDSEIDNFAAYQLDARGNSVRKPDSLFMECRKPQTAALAKKAA
ncbi:MAG TPA: methyltransferase domain-containing protein [Pirellulaceae bacterium]|nr:methyltransferase domain-containing protein [Pirellulaceae bacterium]HMO93330.1 methyltransferase domain-containing protein [Pirellulaceae bacterium]HMP70101.1 methyltransferase domain-containing protein [Pirellulaceae bacterium]